VRLRPALPVDADALAALGRESFVAKFGHLYRPEDLAAFLAESHSPEKAAKEIADAGMAIMLAEDEDGALLGFCKLVLDSSLKEHGTARRPLELKQLYTAPARTGGGIGARLMDWVLDLARERGADEVQLSVWSENEGAQRFYARYGFAKIADITFAVGEQIDHEYLFALRL